jgi:hypothetical protein
MDIEQLVMGARAYKALKGAGIDTVEDLCLFTGEQLMHLGNFGKKSLEDVQCALAEHSRSLHTGPADTRLLVSFPGAGRRFNLGLSASNRDRESLALYTVRELARIQESLILLASHSTGQTRKRLLMINGHVGMLRSVHETVLGKSAEQLEPDQLQTDPNCQRANQIRRSPNWLNEPYRLNPQGVGQPHNVQQSNIAFATLDAADVIPVESR